MLKLKFVAMKRETALSPLRKRREVFHEQISSLSYSSSPTLSSSFFFIDVNSSSSFWLMIELLNVVGPSSFMIIPAGASEEREMKEELSTVMTSVRAPERKTAVGVVWVRLAKVLLIMVKKDN